MTNGQSPNGATYPRSPWPRSAPPTTPSPSKSHSPSPDDHGEAALHHSAERDRARAQRTGGGLPPGDLVGIDQLQDSAWLSPRALARVRRFGQGVEPLAHLYRPRHRRRVDNHSSSDLGSRPGQTKATGGAAAGGGPAHRSLNGKGGLQAVLRLPFQLFGAHSLALRIATVFAVPVRGNAVDAQLDCPGGEGDPRLDLLAGAGRFEAARLQGARRRRDGSLPSFRP